ncbi:regulatory protein GemA [Rheinheimera sp. KL1]|uniref:gp16 family protein n=1 Tax=Rheinheimera sp. KL1 TaxID=1635005 RepID=UPI0006A9CC3D|nr:regulatory protein GemA [Rheinheimera sp. KL1]
MNQANKMNGQYSKQSLIRLIHVAKTKLNMDEESYRAHLAFYGNNKSSSAQMSIPELIAVYEAFKKLGFKPVLKADKTADKKRLSPSSEDGPKDERSAIRAIWIFMAKHGFIQDGTETALNMWVQRMTAQHNGGEGIAEVQWVRNEDAVKLLNSIKFWCRRCMFLALEKQGHSIHRQASYTQVLERFEKHLGKTA